MVAVLKNGRTLLVEINVTHPVEQSKSLGLDHLMEIDLSGLTVELDRDVEWLTTLVLKSTPRRWYRCSLYDGLKRIRQGQKLLSQRAVQNRPSSSGTKPNKQ